MDTEEEKTEPKKVSFQSKSGKGSKGNGNGKSSKGRGNRAHNMESEETAESEESTEAESSSSPVPTTTGTRETGQIDSFISIPPTSQPTIAIREPKSSSSLRVVDSNEERNLVVPLVVSAAAMVFIMIGLVYRRKLVRSRELLRDGGL